MPMHGICAALYSDLATLTAAKKLVLPRRRSVFSAGARAQELYLVVSGLLKRERPGARASSVLQIAGPASLLGEEAVTGLPTYTSTATVVISAEILAIPAEAFVRLADDYPQHWRSLAQWILTQRTALEERAQHLCCSPVRERLLQSFVELAGAIPATEGREPMIPLSQAELACYIGATRETTSTALNQLAREGIVSLHHREVAVMRLPEVVRTATAGSVQM
jgi:CRP-like cAMP-binding protein